MRCMYCRRRMTPDHNQWIYYNHYCAGCDMYYATRAQCWANGEHVRKLRGAEEYFDKPAPYCIVKHIPTIHVDNDFHEWYSGFKLRVKDGIE